VNNQHEKIIEMCYDMKYHCQTEFWRISKSPHKRRIEIEGRKNRDEKPTGRFIFIEQKCEHGISGAKDYMMVENNNWVDPTPPKQKVEIINGVPTLFV